MEANVQLPTGPARSIKALRAAISEAEAALAAAKVALEELEYRRECDDRDLELMA